MHPWMRFLVVVVPLSLFFTACATAAVFDPATLDDTGDSGDNSPEGDGATGNTDDSGNTDPDAGRTPDPEAGYGGVDANAKDAIAKQDTGTDSAPPVDSAPPPDTAPPPTGDCVGSNSQQVGLSYDQACDNYFFNTLGGSNPCTPGANQCAALNGSGGFNPFCCFKPAKNSNCYDDYGGQPQCIPQ